MSGTRFSPLMVTLTIGSSYIPPKKPPTLDALLFGALRLLHPDTENLVDLIPLQHTDGVFHASCMMCDPLFPGGQVSFIQSINNERREDAIPAPLFNARLYSGLGVSVSELRNGGSQRGTFCPRVDKYPLLHRGSVWKVGFFGCGDAPAVESLLRYLPGIGRKARRGYGSIVDVDVDAVEEDYSLMRDGLPMRPIPTALWHQLGGSPQATCVARARLSMGNPDNHEEPCVAPSGGHLPW